MSEALLELTNLVIVGAVPDVRGARHVLTDNPPDVVVTDCELADGDCLDVIEAVREHEPRPAVVVYPLVDVPERGRRCLAAGADLYLPRSLGIRHLQNSVLDVTAGRRPAARLVNDDRFRLIGRLAAGVAHDLNNYLTIVDLSLVRLSRTAEELAGGVNQAREATERAVMLTRCLLEYARGGAPAPTRVDLGRLVRRLLVLFAQIIPSRVRTEVDIIDGPPAIEGVEPELEQLVLNLMLNACDTMPEGGDLRIAVTGDEAAVILEVSDTGIGLEETRLADVDGMAPSSKRAGGAGLGLGIVRSVADHHRATLQVAARPGGGTSVRVVFPRLVRRR